MSASMTRKMLRSPFVLIVCAILIWFIATFLVWPNANLLIATFFPNGSFSFKAVEKLLSSPRAMKSLGNSFLLAIALCVTVNIVGIFIVLVTSYFKVRGARLLWLGYATTFIYGGIVLAAGYKFIYGADGVMTKFLIKLFPTMDIDWFGGFFAVLLVMTFATTTNHMLFVGNALKQLDNQTIEAALNMGASHWTILRKVVLPALKPTLFAVTILSFLTGLGALSAPQVLGGQNFQTITPMILAFARTSTSRDVAALLAIILGIATVLMLAFMSRLERGGTYYAVSKVAARLEKQEINNRAANISIHVASYLLFIIYTSPVVLVILFSFMDSSAIQSGILSADRFTLNNYAQVIFQASILRPFIVSIVYSALASIIVVTGLLFVSRILQKYPTRLSTIIEYLLHIPWILPAALIALGLVITYDRPSPFLGGMVLSGTTVIMLVGFIIVKIPFTLRMLKAAFSSVNDSMEEAAVVMGARNLYIFRRLLLPAVLPAAAAIAALNFISLLDDYDTAVFLAHPLYLPLGLQIKANTDSGNDINAVANTFVFTVLLMIVAGTTMYLVYGRALAGKRRPKKRRLLPLPLTTPSNAEPLEEVSTSAMDSSVMAKSRDNAGHATSSVSDVDSRS